ncbi:hypothetical protein [Pseudosporangium ferrugineum]|uniref:Lipoprotein n=1 Tax=Pseudosporangium ferrugineum TaxID=439699 RepID=A0A2T0S844_9ACTN|nr:hypothetical protein [Pseudosporangium ferrugineum]PRY29597.1 hypothetical protein CLV70_106318 [Pseudosporangium ferrugineum]
MRIFRAVTVPAAVALIAALSACGSTAGPAASEPGANTRNVAHFDGPVYRTVDALDAAADIVVRGTVTRLRATTTEQRLQHVSTRARELPLALYEVSTAEVLRGSAAPTILVTRIDTERLATDAQTPFEPGGEVVLFLRDTTYEWEGADVYSVVGMDQGFFAVEGGKLRGVQKSGTPAAGGRTVAEVAQQVR